MNHVVTAALIVLTITAAHAQQQPALSVTRVDPALDDVIARDTKPELVKGEYFGFTEGPLWVSEPGGGYLLFSDVAANRIYKMTPDGRYSVYLENSGYTGNEPLTAGGQSFNGRLHIIVFGSNGLALDKEGRLIIATHGNRTLERLEKDGSRTVIADRFEGKRLNSPNDLVITSNGTIYFTDPPGGLRGEKDPRRELPYSGVFMLKDGKLQVLVNDPAGRPNGIAFTGDEKTMYVSGFRQIKRYDIRPDGTLANEQLFADMSKDPATGNAGGMKVDQRGNVYSTGPGGVWVFSSAGKHLGTIRFPEQPSSLAFGDADGRSIYVTARTSIYRIRVKIPEGRPGS